MSVLISYVCVYRSLTGVLVREEAALDDAAEGGEEGHDLGLGVVLFWDEKYVDCKIAFREKRKIACESVCTTA